MTRRNAALLLLPVLLLSLMTLKALSHNRPAKSSKVGAPRQGAPQSSFLAELTPKQNKWVESTLRHMSVEEKVGQLFFTTYHGSFTATDSDTYAQMMRDINELHVGGFITITHGSPLGIVKDQAYPTADLAHQLQYKSKLP